MGQDVKLCKTCGEVLPTSEFHRAARERDGLSSRCKVCHSDSQRASRYNMRRAELDAIFERQGGCCAICGADEPGGRWNSWHIDHDRSCCSGRRSCGKCVRGVLCHACNVYGERFLNLRTARALFRYVNAHEQRKEEEE